MTIRPATLDDLDTIVAMGVHFLQQTEYAGQLQVNEAQIRQFGSGLIILANSDILLAEGPQGVVGMIGVLVAPHPFSAERVAGELFWWVEPAARGAGLRLMRAAEAWARRHGAQRFQMVAPNARVARVYERCGFARLETTYQKDL